MDDQSRHDTISERMRAILHAETQGSRRFKLLAEKTGISSTSWTSWFHGRQRATEEMVQSVARIWPQYAFWLATGIDDSLHGHTLPAAEVRWPNDRPSKSPRATSYFVSKLGRLAQPEPDNWEDHRLAQDEDFIGRYARNLEHQKLIEALRDEWEDRLGEVEKRWWLNLDGPIPEYTPLSEKPDINPLQSADDGKGAGE